MDVSLKTLGRKEENLLKKLCSLGDFRLGTISASYRKCGKKGCVCARKGHRGHGPQYLYTTKRHGKSVTEYLRLGPELEQAEKQVKNGYTFNDWYREFVETNELICQRRPVPEIEDEQKLTLLKKKLRMSGRWEQFWENRAYA